MQEDEIDVCNDDNATECEPSTSSTVKQLSNHSNQNKKKNLMILFNKNCFSFYIEQKM